MKIYIIAGEASGDLHGANLIQALRRLSQETLQIHGVGGDRIRDTGALDFFDVAHFHVTGITQAIKKIPLYKKAGAKILSDIQRIKPKAVILIDNPGFNLYLAKKIHAMNIPIVYYISPQIWAWKKNRVFRIKRYVSKMLVVFEFEKKIYEEHDVPVDFVGHPLKDVLSTATSPAILKPLITLMPGSRKHEVATLLPIMLEAAKIIQKNHPRFSFQLIESPTLSPDFYKPFLTDLPLQRIQNNSYAAIRESQLVLVCSGTATLECAILGTPMIIVNRASLLTYLLARALIRVPYLGLPNLILNRPAVPELLQYKTTPQNVAAESLRVLENQSVMDQMRKDMEEVSQKLGEGGASNTAAKKILELLSLS